MSLTIKEYGEAVFTNYYMTTLGEINSTLFELSEVTSDHISLSFTYKGPPLGEKIATNDVLKQVFYGAFTSAGSLVGVDSLAALGQVGFSGVVLSSNLYVNEVMW